MKAYGTTRKESANRNISGTSRPCPCCIPKSRYRTEKAFKVRARRENKKKTEEKDNA